MAGGRLAGKRNVDTSAAVEGFVRQVAPLISRRLAVVFKGERFLHGGKKLRGALTVLVARALGANSLKAVEYAAWVELVHAGTLLEDDWLDGHTERAYSHPHLNINSRGMAKLLCSWG